MAIRTIIGTRPGGDELMQKEHFGVRDLWESDGHGSQERGFTGQVWADFRVGNRWEAGRLRSENGSYELGLEVKAECQS